MTPAVLSAALLFSAAPPELVDALEALPASKSACSEEEVFFDYWPEGGLRTLLCHGRAVLSLSRLQALAGMPIFVSGPHGQRMDLNHKTDFGHYNRDFVRWLGQQIPNGATRRATQPVYDKYLRPRARLYFAVERKMRADPGWVARKSDELRQAVARGQALEGMWGLSSFMGPSGFDPVPKDGDWGAFDPSLQRAAVMWWLRRDMDQSRDLFADGLTHLLRAYDAAWLDAELRRPPPSTPAAPVAGRAKTVREAWTALDHTRGGGCSESTLGFDYWPSGGMRNFYCRARTVLPWKAFMALVPMQPFLSGPHGRRGLDLNHPTDFGRYNPDFVRWLERNLVPAAEDRALRASTQHLYDKYVRELARTHWAVWQALQRDPGRLRAQVAALTKDMRAGRVRWGRYQDYEVLDERLDPNLQRTAALFWLRRSYDETAPLFVRGLERLLRAYDARWLQKR